MAKPLEKTFDPKCYELAEAFVDDAIELEQLTPARREEHCNTLAATIQEAIEGYLTTAEEEGIDEV